MRFYALQAPPWWPHHLADLVHGLDPRPRPRGRWRAKSVILDNGAFIFYRRGSYPDIDVWVARLLAAARVISSVADEVVVVLPDAPLDPDRTLEFAARASKRLCRDYRCVLPLQWHNKMPWGEVERKWRMLIDSVDADIYAVPLKLNAMRYYSGKRRAAMVDVDVQLRAVRLANVLVKDPARIHMLAPAKETVRRAWRLAASFDTTSWTRVQSAGIKRSIGTISARSDAERELFFAHYVHDLMRAGVVLDIDREVLDRVTELAGSG